jgi:hypothetical protein
MPRQEMPGITPERAKYTENDARIHEIAEEIPAAYRNRNSEEAQKLSQEGDQRIDENKALYAQAQSEAKRMDKKLFPKRTISPERQAENETSRILRTAELLKGGAEHVPGKGGKPRLETTEEQKTAGKLEMGEDFYKRYQYLEEQLEKTREQLEKNRKDIQIERDVNGIKIEIFRDSVNPKYYDIWLPQLSDIDKAELEKADIYDPYLRFADDNELAMEVFEYASELAKTGKDVIEVFKGVEQFVREKR